jgi:hypothetical protein
MGLRGYTENSVRNLPLDPAKNPKRAVVSFTPRRKPEIKDRVCGQSSPSTYFTVCTSREWRLSFAVSKFLNSRWTADKFIYIFQKANPHLKHTLKWNVEYRYWQNDNTVYSEDSVTYLGDNLFFIKWYIGDTWKYVACYLRRYLFCLGKVRSKLDKSFF